MTNRTHLITDFIAKADWHNATRSLLAGDASNRRYDRLTRPDGTTAVLMDAPPDKGEDIRPFIAITDYLRGIGLNAPQIFAQDSRIGLLLLEDFGDALFAHTLEKESQNEQKLYLAATNVLLRLHRADPPAGTGAYDPTLMGNLAGLAATWYAGANTDTAKQISSLTTQMIQRFASDGSVLILRDFHAENLIWLPENVGTDRVGLLDYQDAMTGHPAYDLASLLRDARRDVSPATLEAALLYYIETTNQDNAPFRLAFSTVSAQRNLRILGAFGRLSLLHDKPQYVDLIPRVWRNLMADLEPPELNELRDLVLRSIPAPNDAHLNDLRERRGTCQTQP